MPTSVQAGLRAVRASLAARFEAARLKATRRRSAARGGAAAEPLCSPQMKSASGPTPDDVQGSSPRRWTLGSSFRHAVAAVCRLRDKFKRPVASGSTQTDPSPETRPVLEFRQSSLSQAEAKQPVIDSNAAVIAELQRELAALRHGAATQGDIQLSLQGAALRCTWCTALTQLSQDEERARGDVELEVDTEWAGLMLSHHLSCETIRAHRGPQNPHALVSRSGAGQHKKPDVCPQVPLHRPHLPQGGYLCAP
eukprot:TRINITY_DN21281_c0_g1_i2.p1 TRINITY_DN21281_c0_g1~~TRINITY_DN21281_c0_g1_i2.p1  ORF type:complete len:274 (+),score=25.07 TRINITY_DN21281_c0_g1_i2:69-824(+)